MNWLKSGKNCGPTHFRQVQVHIQDCYECNHKQTYFVLSFPLNAYSCIHLIVMKMKKEICFKMDSPGVPLHALIRIASLMQMILN